MKHDIAQAVGLNTDQEAALVLSSNVDEGLLLAVLKLTCDDAFTKGRQTLADIEDFYIGAEGTIADKLNSTFLHAQELLTESEKYSLVLGLINGKVLYFINFGDVSIYLKRLDKISSLSGVASPKQLVSGFLVENDRLFISTQTLVNFLGEGLEKSLSLSLEDWEAETSSKIGTVGLDDQGLAGLIVDMTPEVTEEDISVGFDGALPDIAPLEGAPHPKTQKTFVFKNPLSIVSTFLSKRKKVETPQENYQSAWSNPQASPKKKFNIGKFIPKSNKGRLLLGLLLILILGTGAVYQYKKAQNAEKERSFNNYMQQARDDFNAAENLKTLNPAETKNKLDSAKKELEQALLIKPGNSDAINFRKQIDDNQNQMLQQFSAANFPLFLDLSLIKKGFSADRMSLSGTNLLLLDPNTASLVSVDINKKSNKVLAGSTQLGDGKFASNTGDSSFVFSGDKGVVKIDNNAKASTVAKVDKDLSGVVDIAGFASNVYLLDPKANQIWKYVATTDGYSDKRNYLNTGVKADFSGAKRMQIESSVYVLKDNGDILRFIRGAADTFSISGLDKPLKNPKSIFASTDADNVYILDSGNSRLVVADKAGVYKAQYQGDKFGIASDLVVDEKNKKVYLLDGSKIYSADLK